MQSHLATAMNWTFSIEMGNLSCSGVNWIFTDSVTYWNFPVGSGSRSSQNKKRRERESSSPRFKKKHAASDSHGKKNYYNEVVNNNFYFSNHVSFH